MKVRCADIVLLIASVLVGNSCNADKPSERTGNVTELGPFKYRNLTPEEMRALPDNRGYGSIFSRNDVVAALEILRVDAKEKEEFLRTYYDDPPLPGPVFFGGDVLNALSLVSAETAEKVRDLLNESPEEAARRIAEFRKQLPPK